MHLNILDKNQTDLLPFLAKFKREFYMVGGTAISLYLGHRKSIDFDMFKRGTVKARTITKKFEENKEKYIVTLNIDGQLNLICREVKFTFFNYDFDIPHNVLIGKHIKIPTLLDLAAMKAYALGHRSKWKDYVDLYFLIKDYYTINMISSRAYEIYKDLLSEKLFRGQLGYFKGINYSEQVEYMPGFEVPESEIKEFLVDAALTGF
jgi:Nucleotidyl transferase AbiEii toxin, Type IV TA system